MKTLIRLLLIANSEDPDQTAPLRAVRSGSVLFAQTYLLENFGSLPVFERMYAEYWFSLPGNSVARIIDCFHMAVFFCNKSEKVVFLSFQTSITVIPVLSGQSKIGSKKYISYFHGISQ